MTNKLTIESLSLPAAEADIEALAALLIDAIASGAAVSFLDSLSIEEAESWWRSMLGALHPRAGVLVARDASGIVGTVQLQPAWAPNQPHRAEIVKMLVHRRVRRMGLARRLMVAAEAFGRERGFTLLTLDAKAGTPAHQLYLRLGWTITGTVPRYALDPDGTPHDAVFLHKEL